MFCSSRSFKKTQRVGFFIDSAVMPMHSLYRTALSHYKHRGQIVSLALQGISQMGIAVSLMGRRDRAGCN